MDRNIDDRGLYSRAAKIVLALCTTIIIPLEGYSQLVAHNNVIDIGKVYYESPVTASFAIENKYNYEIEIKDIRTNCGCVVASVKNKHIGKGKIRNISVTYDSRMLGHFEKIIAIYADGNDSPLLLRMKGIVVDDPILVSNKSNKEKITQQLDKDIENAPKIVILPEKMVVAEFGNKKKICLKTNIFNRGKSTLEISSVNLMTEGIEVSISSRRIKARCYAKVKITLFRDLIGNKRTTGLELFTNDPENERKAINIKIKQDD